MIIDNDNTLEYLLKLLNRWWEEEQTPNDLTKANVASIYKKGNTDQQENYRPISLLKSIYKLYAVVMVLRGCHAHVDGVPNVLAQVIGSPLLRM